MFSLGRIAKLAIPNAKNAPMRAITISVSKSVKALFKFPRTAAVTMEN
jgi:hypothetical protein